ncbi:hypothetical protein [uncultured Streptococcus sp.]|uniref:hypothetical protein n=1 Tax=uncultured Streptococcus sp. TaxID=83427 RepID=UPI0025990F44|nr:hypothetical protein [uncultured Streptococcus sp.]
MTKIVWRNANNNYYVTETVNLGFKEEYNNINCAKSDKEYLDYLFNSNHVETSINGHKYVKVAGYYFDVKKDNGDTFKVFCLSKQLKEYLDSEIDSLIKGGR